MTVGFTVPQHSIGDIAPEMHLTSSVFCRIIAESWWKGWRHSEIFPRQTITNYNSLVTRCSYWCTAFVTSVVLVTMRGILTSDTSVTLPITRILYGHFQIAIKLFYGYKVLVICFITIRLPKYIYIGNVMQLKLFRNYPPSSNRS